MCSLFTPFARGFSALALALTALTLSAVPSAHAQTGTYFARKIVKNYSTTTPPPYSLTLNHYFRYGAILPDGRVSALVNVFPSGQHGVSFHTLGGGETRFGGTYADTLLSATDAGAWTATGNNGSMTPDYLHGTDASISALTYQAANGTQTVSDTFGSQIHIDGVHRFATLDVQAVAARDEYAVSKVEVRFEDFSNDKPDVNIAGDHNYIALRRYRDSVPGQWQEVCGVYTPENVKYPGGYQTAYGSPATARYGGAQYRITSIKDIAVDDAGNVAFSGTASAAGSAAGGFTGVFVWGGSGEPLMCRGQEPGGTYTGVTGLSVSGTTVAFRSLEYGAIFTTNPWATTPTRIVGPGDTSNGYAFTFVGSRFTLQGSKLLFRADYRPANDPSAPTRAGLFVWRDGKAQRIAYVGQTIDGGSLSSFGAWDMNAAGTVVFSYVRTSRGGATTPFLGTAYYGRYTYGLPPL